MTRYLAKIRYFGNPVEVVCDGNCSKAWGINSRLRAQLSDDPEDFAFKTDHELGTAPEDPGTYEREDAKPVNSRDFPNRWCVRQCERSAITKFGTTATPEVPTFDERVYNITREG